MTTPDAPAPPDADSCTRTDGRADGRAAWLRGAVLVACLVVGWPLAAVRAAPQDRDEPLSLDRLAAEATEHSLVEATRLAQAVEAYRAGHYDEALEVFASLADEEWDPDRRAVLHANAGTAAARADDLGRAVWHLRAALRAAPRDAVARENLTQVRARLGLGDSEQQEFTGTLMRLPLWLTPREARQLMGAGAALGLLLLALWRLGWLGPRAAAAAVAVMLLDGGFLLADEAARAADARRAVVLESVAVRAEPDEVGQVLFRLDPGTVVSEEESRGDWRLVETAAGGRGWAPASGVRPPPD